MARPITVRIEVRMAWWLGPYLAGITLPCWLTGVEPDLQKVGRTMRRALRTRVVAG